VQHVEYVPFGEVFIEERNNKWNTPYLFNAKELDEETGLYYYGARYYDPRVSLWLSVDPLLEKTGMAYQYCYQNPICNIDPLGMDTVPSNEIWEHYLINYRTDGYGIHDMEKFYLVKNKDNEIFKIFPIISGENESNYIAMQLYGKDYIYVDGEKQEYDIYEYKYVIGKDRLEDFMQGETKGDGFLRGLVKLAVDGGMDGRASFGENVKTYLKQQYNPVNIVFSVATPHMFDLAGIAKTFKGMVRSKPTTKVNTNVPTPKPAPSVKAQTWNEFQRSQKGMYTKEKYGTVEKARQARSIDYKKMKDNK